MRQFFIDEIDRHDLSKLQSYLEAHASPSSMEGLYWVELSRDILDPEQFECENDHPFCFAVETGDGWAKFEFLIRSRTNMHSRCVRYASPVQQKFILDYANRLIQELNLKT